MAQGDNSVLQKSLHYKYMCSSNSWKWPGTYPQAFQRLRTKLRCYEQNEDNNSTSFIKLFWGLNWITCNALNTVPGTQKHSINFCYCYYILLFHFPQPPSQWFIYCRNAIKAANQQPSGKVESQQIRFCALTCTRVLYCLSFTLNYFSIPCMIWVSVWRGVWVGVCISQQGINPPG